MRRTAVRTPGMKDPVEGVVADGEHLALPAEEDLLMGDQPHRLPCVGMPSTRAPRAPSGSSVVASGTAGRPASVRAAAMSADVRAAVPDGASTLFGWCSSMTSTDS